MGENGLHDHGEREWLDNHADCSDDSDHANYPNYPDYSSNKFDRYPHIFLLIWLYPNRHFVLQSRLYDDHGGEELQRNAKLCLLVWFAVLIS
jgi:hypothetical protein